MHSQHDPSAPVAALGTVLGVWAHPDDEAYFTAGLMALARSHGNRVVVATATAGEGGPTGDGLSPEALAAVRRDELAACLSTLGVAEHHWLGHPDGGCDGVPASVGTRQVEALLEAVRPDTVVTFGDDGFTGHDDHRAVGRWTRAAWVRSGQRARLLHPVVTRRFAWRHRVANDRFLWMQGADPRPVDDDEVDLVVDCTGSLGRLKLAALRAHRTQTSPIEAAMGRAAYRDWFRREAFAEIAPSDAGVGTARVPGRAA